MVEPRHFSIAVVDIEGSGELSGPDKVQVRAALYGILDAALRGSGVTTRDVIQEDRGDGVYLLVPAEVPVRRLMHPFVGLLDSALAERRVADPKLRLRLAVHQGAVALDSNGSSGAAVDLTFALVDAPPLRHALKASPAGRLAVVVPDDLFQGVVRGQKQPDPAAFRMRLLKTKRGLIRTWVTVTGASAQPGGDRDEDALPPPPVNAAIPSFSVHNGDEWNIKRAKNNGVMGTVNGDVSVGSRPERGGDN